MVEAMFVHDVDESQCQEGKCGFENAAAFNLQLAVDTGDGNWCCIHALTETEVAPDSMGAELLRTAAVLFSRRARSTIRANFLTATANPGDGAPAVPGRPRGHGIHNHTAPDSTQPDTGCVDPVHHPSCATLFGTFPETKCVFITGSSPKKWSCAHDENA